MRDSQDKRNEEGEITGGNLGGKLFCTRPYLILVQAFNCRILYDGYAGNIHTYHISIQSALTLSFPGL